MPTVILYSICFGFVWVEVFQMHLRFKLNRKPFNCVKCMAGWCSLPLGLIAGETWYLPFIMFVAMVAAILLTNLINKTT